MLAIVGEVIIDNQTQTSVTSTIKNANVNMKILISAAYNIQISVAAFFELGLQTGLLCLFTTTHAVIIDQGACG